MIKEWTQGTSDTELFKLAGRMMISPKVHEALGATVSGVDGDIWFVDDEGDGFAQIRIAANGSAHIRYAYSEKDGMRKQLIKAAIARAKKAECELIYTNDRKTDEVWADLGFKKKATKRKGDFVRWEMTA